MPLRSEVTLSGLSVRDIDFSVEGSPISSNKQRIEFTKHIYKNDQCYIQLYNEKEKYDHEPHYIRLKAFYHALREKRLRKPSLCSFSTA
jgi:hypothetical protein